MTSLTEEAVTPPPRLLGDPLMVVGARGPDVPVRRPKFQSSSLSLLTWVTLFVNVELTHTRFSSILMAVTPFSLTVSSCILRVSLLLNSGKRSSISGDATFAVPSALQNVIKRRAVTPNRCIVIACGAKDLGKGFTLVR